MDNRLSTLKGGNPLKIKTVIISIIIIVVVFLISPLMNVKDIEVVNNQKFTKEEILELTKIDNNTNITTVFSFQLMNNMADDMRKHYIDDIKLEKDFFKRKLTIDVKERKVSGYVKFDSNSYLYIDKDGRVLEVSSNTIDNHPIIEGLESTKFILGETLEVKNEEAFKTMVKLSHLFEKFDITNDIIRVDVSDEKNIHFFYGKIDIILGDTMDLDKKVRTVKAILPEVEDMKDIGGYIYVDDIDNPPRFEYLL